jgi:hypothetical protein
MTIKVQYLCSIIFICIFQFVPMRNFTERNPATMQAMLAKEVLEEIPNQFLSYMKSRNIKPKGGGNQSTRRKPLICRKSLTNFIT